MTRVVVLETRFLNRERKISRSVKSADVCKAVYKAPKLFLCHNAQTFYSSTEDIYVNRKTIVNMQSRTFVRLPL